MTTEYRTIYTYSSSNLKINGTSQDIKIYFYKTNKDVFCDIPSAAYYCKFSIETEYKTPTEMHKFFEVT